MQANRVTFEAESSKAVAPQRRRRKKTVKRKPFFGFRLMDFYDAGYRNMARCLGISHRQLFDYALIGWAEEAEKVLGFNLVKASRLSRAQCREIFRRIHHAQEAARSGGNQQRN